MMSFDYKRAFARNIGWVTPEEQEILRNSTIAIGGLGGVGGDHIITLARMGVTKFHIADLDHFDYSNFNRQAGANIDTIGKSKVSVTIETITKINPEIKVKTFQDGINEANIDQFLEGVDLYVDSLDIFAVSARRLVFNTCEKKGIPALTAAPLAMGVAFLSFAPGSMRFDDYFGMKDPDPKILNKLKGDRVATYSYILENYAENILKFISGVGPTGMQRHYLVDPSKVDFFRKDLPSFKTGIDIAAGTMCANVLKELLHRGKILRAPHGIHFDAYLNRCVKTWRPCGYKNPLQILLRMIIRKKINLSYKFDLIKETIKKKHQNNELKETVSEQEMYEFLSTFSK